MLELNVLMFFELFNYSDRLCSTMELLSGDGSCMTHGVLCLVEDLLNVFLKNGPIRPHLGKLNKHLCCAWDSNPGPQNDWR